MKSVQIRSYFWYIFSCIQSEYRKIRTRSNSVFRHFSRSDCLDKSTDNYALSIYGYNIIRADHPFNQKRGGVCIYFNEQLQLKQVITPNFSECVLCEVLMRNKIGYIAVTYLPPSQTASEFAIFLENFEKLLYQIQQFRSSFVVILGDFNSRSKSWWNEDIISNDGSQIDLLTTTCGLGQLI